MRGLKYLLNLTLIGLIACNSDPTDPDDPQFQNPSKNNSISVDISQKHQTMHHFGASDGWSVEVIGKNWPVAIREQLSEALFSKEFDQNEKPMGIGLSMWRTNIGSGSANQENSGFDPAAWFRMTSCALQPDGTYDWENNQEGSRWFMKKAKDYGVEYITDWVTSPPYFMTKSGFTFATPDVTGYNLQEDKYAAFADYLADYVSYHESIGIPIDFVSPINEPQYNWSYQPGTAFQEGTFCSDEEAFGLVKEIDRSFQEKSVSAKVILPESSDLRVMYSFVGQYPLNSNQIDSFWSSTSPTYLGNLSKVNRVIAGHSYWSNSNLQSALDNREKIREKSLQNGAQFWQTEYSLLGEEYQEGREINRLNEIDYMLWLARLIHWDVALANASGWSFWTAMSVSDFGDHKNRFGLFSWRSTEQSRNSATGTVEASRLLWTLGHYSRFVRPGYQRVEATHSLYNDQLSASTNLMVSAFLSPDQSELVLVLVNYSDKIEKFSLDGIGSDLKIKEGKVTAYLSTNAQNMQPELFDRSEIIMPGKSIMTVISKLN